jgi:hypothetical protein
VQLAKGGGGSGWRHALQRRQLRRQRWHQQHRGAAAQQARQHARQVRDYLRERFAVELDPRMEPDSTKCAIFCDPHGKGEGDTDYQTHYMAMQGEGLDVFSPARKQIQRAARIGMVNRLLSPADGPPRLVVAIDAQKLPAAPVLVDAIESLVKRAGEDNPEGARRKDEADKTHAPAALAYGLWPFEQESLTADTIRRALAAARRYA